MSLNYLNIDYNLNPTSNQLHADRNLRDSILKLRFTIIIVHAMKKFLKYTVYNIKRFAHTSK